MRQSFTLKLELWKPTLVKQLMYVKMTERNTAFANWLLAHPEIEKPTSKVFSSFSQEKLSSAVVCQTIRNVVSKRRHQNAQQFRKLWCEFNNQNLRIEHVGAFYTASFPTLEKRIGVPLVVKDHQQKWLEELLHGEVKQGSAKLVHQRGKWYLLLSVTKEIKTQAPGTKVMGIDLGLRYLAVASVGTRTLFFKGNQATYVRRRFASLRRKLGKAKKLDAIRKISNKEQHWMRDQNHKVSRKLIDHAITNGVGVLRMEDLTNIRKTAKRRSEKQQSYLHKWAFYQLQQMIKYKAQLAGIQVEYVKPTYTSQTCRYGHQEKESRQGIRFCCTICGDKRHADENAAMNIAKAISGVAIRHSGNRSVAKRTTSGKLLR